MCLFIGNVIRFTDVFATEKLKRKTTKQGRFIIVENPVLFLYFLWEF